MKNEKISKMVETSQTEVLKEKEVLNPEQISVTDRNGDLNTTPTELQGEKDVPSPMQINVADEKEDLPPCKGSTQVDEKEDKDTTERPPVQLTDIIISLAEEGYERTLNEAKYKEFNYDDARLKESNLLFSHILYICKHELRPAIENIKDYENLNDELMVAGDILAKVINYVDKGYRLTYEDGDKNTVKIQESNYIFGMILTYADVKLRVHIPTPVKDD